MGPMLLADVHMSVPNPAPILRFIHIDNLHIYLRRAGIHSPNDTPQDGLVYRPIHNVDVQAKRRHTPIPCGPGGTVHDYVPFYFGPLSPMMLNLKTGRVPGYDEGQESLIYLVSTAEALHNAGTEFVFSDGHGIAMFTEWFDDLAELGKVDWTTVGARYWSDTLEDMDRQRRKQAEFLAHRFVGWSLVDEIVAFDKSRKTEIESILGTYKLSHRPTVSVHRDWYYW